MYKFQELLVSILFLPLGFSSLVDAGECVIKMGYRLEDKQPFMAGVPDNSGLYKEIYTQAAEAIKCRLVIIRKPKKRILKDLEAGRIDFYPAYNFTEKRSETAYFIPTGLVKKNVGISRSTLPEITHLSQLKGNQVMIALGSLNPYKSFEGVKVSRIPNLSIKKVIVLLYRKKVDFYYSNYSEFLYSIKINPPQGSPLKIHHLCCGEEKIVYLALSKKSSKFQEIPNPNFKVYKPISPTNSPIIIDPSSIAYQFNEALKQMIKEGVIRKLYVKFFK